MKNTEELIDEFLNYKGIVYSSRVWKEMVRRLKLVDVIKGIVETTNRGKIEERDNSYKEIHDIVVKEIIQ